MSQVIVLDTHVWLWLVNGNSHLFPFHWQEQFETAAQVGVSPISCYEIALAHQKGRIQLSGTPQTWFAGALDPVGIDLLPLTAEISCRAVGLSPVHKDPFDRLIIATALDYGAQLASVDTVFPRYPELRDCLMR